MGFSLGSVVEKICDKVGLDEDWGDVLALGADAGALYGSLGMAAGVGPTSTMASILGTTIVGSSFTGVLEHAEDLVEDWGQDPMTAGQWKSEIRRNGYVGFERAVRDGKVSDDVMRDPGMTALRQEEEETQANVRSTQNTLDAINARRAAAQAR